MIWHETSHKVLYAIKTNNRNRPNQTKVHWDIFQENSTMQPQICYSNNVIQLYTPEMYMELIFAKSQEKIPHVWHQDIFPKRKRTSKPSRNYENIHPGYENGSWNWKIYYADNQNVELRNNRRNSVAKFGYPRMIIEKKAILWGSNKIERYFFQAAIVSMHYMDAD